MNREKRKVSDRQAGGEEERRRRATLSDAAHAALQVRRAVEKIPPPTHIIADIY